MYKDKKTKEIKSFAYLTRKICNNIPNDFYNNLDEKYGLTNIYMLRPYRLNDGYIGLVTTNNINNSPQRHSPSSSWILESEWILCSSFYVLLLLF